MLNALFWSPTPECLYRDIGSAKQLCSEFRFQLTTAPGYKGQAGFISFDAKGRVTVKPGYVWDGASGPTFDSVDSICASLLHDVCYELMRLGLLPLHVYKPIADLMFYERLLKDGMLQYRAWAWYIAVRKFGHSSCLPESHPKIKRAPVPFESDRPKITSPVPGYFVPA
jgi:hypothetical protein